MTDDDQGTSGTLPPGFLLLPEQERNTGRRVGRLVTSEVGAERQGCCTPLLCSFHAWDMSGRFHRDVAQDFGRCVRRGQ